MLSLGAMVTDFAQMTTQRSSREQHNEILFNSQMQLPADTRGVHDRDVQTSSMMTIGAKGDADKCGADGPMLSAS